MITRSSYSVTFFPLLFFERGSFKYEQYEFFQHFSLLCLLTSYFSSVTISATEANRRNANKYQMSFLISVIPELSFGSTQINEKFTGVLSALPSWFAQFPYGEVVEFQILFLLY